MERAVPGPPPLTTPAPHPLVEAGDGVPAGQGGNHDKGMLVNSR